MSGPSSQSVRVALVEDHAPTRDAIDHALRRFEGRVAAMGTAEALLELLELSSATPSIDVALLDLGLPGMSGSEDGLTYAECSLRMGVSLSTVQEYVKRLYRKLAVNSRGEVRAWVAENLPERAT